MEIEEFISSTKLDKPPVDLPPLLTALWLERNGNWNDAHSIAQEMPSSLGSWVHAYLHRVEGDLGNARYWYSRAGREECHTSLGEEWEEIVVFLLDRENL
jgi:hypothetical protein